MTYVPTAPLTRRTVIGAACAGCATLVAGCGGSDGEAASSGPASTAPAAAPPSSAPSSSAAASSAPAAAALASLADIEVGGAVSAQADGKKIIIVRTGEATAAAFDAKCPHQGCAVMPAGKELDCPCHGSRFGTDGAVLQGPAKKGLTPFPVTVTGGDVVAA